MDLVLYESGKAAEFLYEKTAFPGVKRVAGKVVDDYNKRTGANVVCKEIEELSDDDGTLKILFATCGNSPILDKLTAEELINPTPLFGCRECFGYFYTENLFVIAGSDKLGTEFGMFGLSQMMGISPLVYWADAVVVKSDTLTIRFDNNFVSLEPSVYYRGFFINDEWPCFGNWTTEHFGGFTAEMYDHVFELLLRLKGNYLWPAMWSSSFAWDGPGLKSFELADEYGIYMGNSHHEPCFRAGEEYRQVRGKDSPYGDAWSFWSNEAGITKFWEDSLNERAHLNGVCTVGMRGEADSTILGANATLADNIKLIKDVITRQKELLAKQEERLGKTIPKMLALYKEVEPFYYGDENTEGLCDWDGLDDVILMLCEDNHNYLRSLPDEKMKNHPAGFGMYYHVDYHGDPVSYEWINSTPLNIMWEQMCEAYEEGVNKLWILNVGDLKHNEFPLTFFMQMAYDFNTFGSNYINKTDEYTVNFVNLHFGGLLSQEQLIKVASMIKETTKLLSYRRPEALTSHTYHPCHYNEGPRMAMAAEILNQRNQILMKELPEEAKDAYYSLIGFQAEAAANHVSMMVYSGLNELFASQGRPVANNCAVLVEKCFARDKALKNEFAAFKDGKWKGMELEAHIGFRKWNEDGCVNPVRMYIDPVDYPRMTVVRDDSERIYDKQYGAPARIIVDDFLYDDISEVTVSVCNTGIDSFNMKVDIPDNDWVTMDCLEATVKVEKQILIKCNRDKLTDEPQTVVARITGAGTTVDIEITGKKVEKNNAVKLKPYGYAVNASDYNDKHEINCEIKTLKDFGITGSAVKVYPADDEFNASMTYYFDIEKEGTYTLELWAAPTSPMHRDGLLRYGLSVNDDDINWYNAVPRDYKAGNSGDRIWAEGVLSHRRVMKHEFKLQKGIQRITLAIGDKNFIPYKLFVYDDVNCPKTSYLGPRK